MPQAPNILLRERLVGAVDARWQGGLGVVLGGAGLGKSTLLRQAMLESATLGRGSEALVRCRPDWTASSVHAAVCRQLGAAEALPDEPSGERVAEYLWSCAPDRVGLVFDDVYLLDESGIAYVIELREALPSNAHLLVATRETPLLTALLITADPSFVVDGSALLFTEGEVDAFAAETSADRPALQSAGGWPAVLALTASAGSDVADAYLYQKVLAGLNRRQQGDLAVAAALGELDADLAAAVLEGSTADLAAIPLVEIPPGGGIIVHDLWREPLAGLIDEERLQAARRTAASHAESTGDVDRAVSVLTEGGLAGEARAVMLGHIALGADRVPVDRVDRWLRGITSPDQALLRQLLQLLRDGLEAGSLSELELDEVTDRFRDANQFDLEAVVCEIRFAAAWSADESAICLGMAERLHELHGQGVPGTAHGRFLRDITTARSERDNARVLEVIYEARDALGPTIGPQWNSALELETLVALGRPFEALTLLEATDHRLSGPRIRSVSYALTYWFSGRPDDALRSLDTILREAGRFEGLERSWQATNALFRLYRGLVPTEPFLPSHDEHEWFSLYSRVCEGLAEVAQAIHDGDEDGATALIGELAERLPPAGGFTLQAWFMGAAMWYGLRPADRELLDAFMVDNIYGEAGALFRSFVAGRELGVIDDELIGAWPTPSQVGTLLPARWAAEVALRLPAKHQELRNAVLDGLEEKGKPVLELIGEGPEGDLAALALAVLAERPNAPGDPVRVRLFGLPQLVVSGHEESPDWRRGRVKALLGFLATTRRRRTRESMVDALWPDLDLQAGRRNLRVTLSYLTRALEPTRPKNTPPWFVRADGETLWLQAEGLDSDLVAFQAGLSDAQTHRRNGVASKAIESLRVAVEAYGGPFLEGLDDEWIVKERLVFERQAVNACLRLAALLQAGRSDEAIRWIRRAIEIDPLSIDAHEALVELLVAQSAPPAEIDMARARLVALLSEGD